MTRPLRLGVNIDHVATLRNARGGAHPDPIAAAELAARAGADGITVHLREDRRHIRDADLDRLKAASRLPINLELAATPEMTAIACRVQPHACCVVPERRSEVTTEGGLDAVGLFAALEPPVHTLAAAGIRVSLFIDPDPAQVRAAHRLGAPVIELHTGAFCYAATAADRARELSRLAEAAAVAEALGVECHAGHGITYDTVGPIAAIPTIVELNIGHFLIGEAVFVGLEAAIRRMREGMDAGRRG